jgi:hypothetical protein
MDLETYFGFLPPLEKSLDLLIWLDHLLPQYFVQRS